MKWATRCTNSIQTFMLQDSMEKKNRKPNQSSQTTNFKIKYLLLMVFFCVCVLNSNQASTLYALDVHPCNLDTAIEPKQNVLFFLFRSICIIVNYYNYEMQPSSLTTDLPVHEIRSNEKKKYKTCWCAIVIARFSQKYTHWNPKFYFDIALRVAYKSIYRLHRFF